MNSVEQAINKTYQVEGCGICEKEGGEVFWFSDYSRCAHTECYQKIEPVESTLIQTIDSFFRNKRNYGKHNDTHIAAVRAVKKACGSEPFLTYMEKNGSEMLKHLFDTVGVHAATQYKSMINY